jgi:hypothetical protein
MEEYPITISGFNERFSTEEQCRAYLYALRFPEGFVCPKCAGKKAWPVGELLFECTSCGRQTSVIAGTIFQDTRKPVSNWFAAIWWVTTQKYGANAKGLQQVLGLGSYQTAWTWLHKIRKAMVNPNRARLSGDVEIDEAYIGSVDEGGKRGRGAENKALLILATELRGKKLGRIRISAIPDASSDSLHDFITENIEPNFNKFSNEWGNWMDTYEYYFEKSLQKRNKD